MTQPHPAQAYIDRHARNLDFFRHRFPGIYQFFSSYQMQRSKLDILLERAEVDILTDGRHLYSGQASAAAKQEVARFLSGFDYGSRVYSMRPLDEKAYMNPRLFSRSIADVYKAYYGFDEPYSGYQLGELFPFVVFMGIGLGKHIDVLNKIREIDHVLVFETDMDHFAASLYSVDWPEIIGDRLDNPERSFEFVLAHNARTEEQMHAVLWDRLIEYCPIFPVTTLFYNHRGNPVYDRVSDRVNQNLVMHLFSFGNYDDELNQLNNALFNIRQSHTMLPSPELYPEALSQLNELSVCIVGSGPSLDARIDELRAMQSKTLIISCGTALGALYAHQIKPDLHIELESDYCTYSLQSMMQDKAWLKSIKLIGAAQLNPNMFDLFGESRLFYKEDGVLSGIFSELKAGIPHAAPTCTNAALALAIFYRFKQIFLFGMDFGFPDKRSHHAKGSVYYQNEKSSELKAAVDYADKDMLMVPAAGGGSIATTHFLHSAKLRVEVIIASMNHRDATKGNLTQIFNCSNGAHIEGSRYLDSLETSQHSSALVSLDISNVLSHSLFTQTAKIDRAWVNRKLNQFTQQLHKEVTGLLDILASAADASERISFTRLCYRLLSRISSKRIRVEDRAFYYFMRGSVWHFLLAGYCHLYALPTEKARKDYFTIWTEAFGSFLKLSLHQSDKVLCQADNDHQRREMFQRTIWQIVSNDLEVAQWQYQGYKIERGKLKHDTIEWEFTGRFFNGKKFVPYTAKSP